MQGMGGRSCHRGDAVLRPLKVLLRDFVLDENREDAEVFMLYASTVDIYGRYNLFVFFSETENFVLLYVL